MVYYKCKELRELDSYRIEKFIDKLKLRIVKKWSF